MKFPDTLSITLPLDVFELIEERKNELCAPEYSASDESTTKTQTLHFLVSVMTPEALAVENEDAALYFWILATTFPERAVDLLYDRDLPLIYQLLCLLEDITDITQLRSLLAQFRDHSRLNYK